MPKQIKAFACEFKCRKVLTKKQSMIEHEARCFHNPETKSCATCGNFVKMEGVTNPNGSVHYFNECAAGICTEFKLKTNCNSYISKG